ncbi:MAG: RCC1 domain-containing protein [Myxococcota bacterium]
MQTAQEPQVGSASDWSDIAAGVQHTCGIRSGGQLWCWGRNDDYEFGDTTTLPAEEPRQVIGNNDYWR